MKLAIISSKQDLASVNIRNNLINNYDFKKTNEIYELKIDDNIITLYTINDELIHAEDLEINADFFIFISKHVSKENTPSFTTHSIGNWDKADFGGKDKTLCPSSALLLKNMFLELLKNSKEKTDYETTLEATHHGPFTEKPTLFIEIGSTEKEWNDKNNGKIIAATIINSLKNNNNNQKIAIGLGGTHYCNNFVKILKRTDIAFSYICPKYMLEKLNKELLQQAIQKTKEKVDFIVLDWKGLGKEKQNIIDLLKELNLEYKRTDQIN